MPFSTAALEKKLANLPKGFISLILVPAKDYNAATMSLLKLLIKKKKAHGIYISVNRPVSNLEKILEGNGVDTSKVFFVDCITKSVGGTPTRQNNALFLNSPRNLTDLGIVIDQATQAMGDGEKFLFLDSVSTLLMYHSRETVSQFSHFLSGRMRVRGLAGVFVSVEAEADSKLITSISEFCDSVIRID